MDYVSVEGVPLGYAPTGSLGERKASRGQPLQPLPEGRVGPAAG